VTAFVGGPAIAEAPDPVGEPLMSPVHAPVPQSLLLEYLADPSTFTLIDARSPEEYAESHIDGAINVPHDRLEEFAGGLPTARDGTVVVYCRTGKRAGRLQAQLAERGYSDVRVLEASQISSSDGLMVFNCGAYSTPPAAGESAAGDAGEEETNR
jgi:rhodanese-related sulfurtransferase